MDALAPDVGLPPELDRLTDPDLDLCRARRIVPMEGGTLLVAFDRSGEGALHVLEPEGGTFRRIGAFETVDEVWPAGPEGALVRSEKAVWRLMQDGRQGKLLDLPEGSGSVDAVWTGHGLVLATIVDRRKARPPEALRILPEARGQVVLCRYTPAEGWMDLAEVPVGCGGLSLSADGRRMVWREPTNVVPEEARRGEFRGFDVAEGRVRRLTEGAGQARRALIAPDGRAAIYHANHREERPITTHADLWWVAWDGGERRNLTGGGRCIVEFGWGPDGRDVWVSTVEGLERKTEVLTFDGTTEGTFDGLAATSPVACLRRTKLRQAGLAAGGRGGVRDGVR